MATGTLSIDLGAIARNWIALDAMSEGETGAVVKADAYGLGAAQVARTLAKAGARSFFVADASEAAIVRGAIGFDFPIYVFSGHMDGDTQSIRDARLIPLLNSIDQMLRHVEAMPGRPFGIQLDTGMNRLGMEPAEWSGIRDIAVAQGPALLISHLACADDPGHPMNAHQLDSFRAMTDGLDIPRSLAATGGALLGSAYHFDMTRPGIGLYGGAPFERAEPVVTLDLPVIQTREVDAGETVGYGNTWSAPERARIATVSGGYADGILRAAGAGAFMLAGDVRCPVVGRISMDLIGVDVTGVKGEPDHLRLIGPDQTIDALATAAGTIGYEILTALGSRYTRSYSE